MKRTALAFLLLPLLFCCAAETADELFQRATVRNPAFILWSCTRKDNYTPEVIANIDKSLEMIRYQMDIGLPVNPSIFISDIMKAQPEKLLITTSYAMDEFQDTGGIDALLAFKTVNPMNASLLIGGIQMLATLSQVAKSTIIENGITVVFSNNNTSLTLQFLEGNTILLLGHTTTVHSIKEGKSSPLTLTLPQPATISNVPFFIHMALPPEMQAYLIDILPEGFPLELLHINTATLLLDYENLLNISLFATFRTQESANGIASFISQQLEQSITRYKDEPTLSKYLRMINVSTNTANCSITAKLPWQICVSSIPAALLLPALSKAREKAQGITCTSNLKQIGLAIVLFADDHDDTLPAADTWEKDIAEYLGDTKYMLCPAVPENKYIYLGKKVKQNTIVNPSRTILVMEDFGNHKRSKKVNLLFADGHVESASLDDEADIEELARKHDFQIIK